MRYSQQREVIKNIVRSTKTHPGADWIYKQAKRIITNISLGTVYRNLKTLEKLGDLRIIYDNDQVRYDGNLEDHHHLKCLECGRIIDSNVDSNVDRDTIIKEHDFDPQEVEIFIFGKCNNHKKGEKK
jgi:Fe2+ or Zn2+ uptake regulation protein